MEDCPCVAIRISDTKDVIKYISDAHNPTASITFGRTLEMKPLQLLSFILQKLHQRLFQES